MYPAVNQTVRLTSFNEGTEAKQYKTTVADISEDFIMVTYPIDEQTGRTSLLLDGWPVYVSYNNPDGNQYEFLTVILRRKRENIPLLVLQKPNKDNINKIQRRNYVRVPAKLKIEFACKGEEQVYSGMTVDISGGGVKFCYRGDIEWPEGKEKVIEAWLYLPDPASKNGQKVQKEMKVSFEAKLVRNPVKDEIGVQTIAASFTAITEAHREMIIRYCFARQLEIRKKLPST
jgi:c-di-GMP-binding flagellar brake protein YcgR